MRKRIVTAACAASVLSLSLATAQTTNTQSGAQGTRANTAASQQDTTVVGCVARGAGGTTQNATFMLNNVQAGASATAAAGVGGSTSARSGTSASGTAGTTAGTGGTTATTGGSATSGTGTDQNDSTAGSGSGQTTTATGQRPGNATGNATANTGNTSGNATAHTNSMSYMLVAGANQNLANYVGQRVEIRGRMVGDAGENRANTSTPAAGASNERTANNSSRFQVTSVRAIGGTCG